MYPIRMSIVWDWKKKYWNFLFYFSNIPSFSSLLCVVENRHRLIYSHTIFTEFENEKKTEKNEKNWK